MGIITDIEQEVDNIEDRLERKIRRHPKKPIPQGGSMTICNIALTNESTVLTDAQVSAIVPDLQTQVTRDFAPAWGFDAQLTFLPKTVAIT